jgi:hypothetical protein
VLLRADGFEKQGGVGGDDVRCVTHCSKCVEDVKATRVTKVAPNQHAHADELRVCESEFFDEKVMAKDVDIFVVDNASDHFIRSEDENVGVGGVDGVDFALLLKRDAGNLGFPGALDERNPEDLAQCLCLIEVLRLEIHGA